MSRPAETKAQQGDVFGFWEIISDPIWNNRSEQRVKAKCLTCGRIYERYAYQFTSNGAKWGCKYCFQENKRKGTLAKDGQKKCVNCLRFLDIGKFGKANRTKDGLAEECKECKRRRQIFYNYNLNESSYQELLERCNNQCMICGATNDLHIDHCHETGEVRGLLCSNCNTAIGLLKENINLFEKAIQYLKDNKEKKNA